MNFSSIKQQTKDIIAFGLAARLLRFFKGILLALLLGASFKMDTYLVAFGATIFLAEILADAMIVSLIPIYQQIDRRDGKKGRFIFTNNLITYWSMISLIFIVLSLFAAPIIIRVFAPGFTNEEHILGVKLFRLGIPIVISHVYRGIFGGYLQSQHKFRAGAKGGIANNIIYIIYLVFFSKRFGLEGLMVVGIIAVASQAFLLAKPVFKLQGYRYKPELVIKDRLLKRLNSFIFPIMIGVGINSLNLTIDNAIASVLDTGTIAELSYATNIIQLFVGITLISITTALFPVISEKKRLGDPDAVDDAIEFSLRAIIIISIPLTIWLFFMARPIVKLLYERGEFVAETTVKTAQMLKYLSLGIIGTGLITLLTRIYYALEDTHLPMVLGGIILALNAVFDIAFAAAFGPIGIALGSSLSLLVTSAIAVYDLNHKLNLINRNFLKKLRQIAIAGVLMLIFVILGELITPDSLKESMIANGIYVFTMLSVSLLIYTLGIKKILLKHEEESYE